MYRLAIELNLNRDPSRVLSGEREARELLNRYRTWLTCYVMDRVIGVNLGKSYMMPEDEIVRSAASKLLHPVYQHSGDALLASLVELFRLMHRYAETMSSTLSLKATTLDPTMFTIHSVVEKELLTWRDVAEERSRKAAAIADDAGATVQIALMRSLFHYCRLVVYSTGLRYVIKAKALDQDEIFFAGCVDAASAVVNIMVDDLAPTGLVASSPDQVFVLSAYGAAILIKCIRPEFSKKLTTDDKSKIIQTIKRLLKTLNGDNIGSDAQSNQNHHARFLQKIVDSHCVEQRDEHIVVDQIDQKPPILPNHADQYSSSLSRSAPSDSGPSMYQPHGVSPSYNLFDSMSSGIQAPPIMPPLFGSVYSGSFTAMLNSPDNLWFG